MLTVRRGTLEDVDQCQRLTRAYAKWFPFVMKVSLREAVNRNSLYVAEVEGNFAGFVSFRECRDAWSTIYELATVPEYVGQGVGRALLYAVPAPVRLKVPVDNEKANTFYTNAGMILDRVETDKPRHLNIYHLYATCIHIQGGNSRVPEYARLSGMAYGTRHTEKPKGYCTMVDINWKKYEWQDYLAKLKQWKPVMAMVADYESPDQRELMLQQVQDLRDLGIIRILVCPKFDGAVKDIPEDCVLAISVPSKYAGFLPNPEEVRHRKVHLLGGSPPKIRKELNNYTIVSVDFNAHTRNAPFGMYWNGEVWKRPTTGVFAFLPFHELIVYSARNIVTMIQTHLQLKYKGV